MTDSHGEGRRREAVIAERYRARGFMVWQPPRTKFRAQDIFGVGDLLAFKGDGKAFMVQVCDKKSVKRHRIVVDRWNAEHSAPLYCYLIVWEGPSRAQGGANAPDPHLDSPKPSKRVESNARPLPARKEGKA